MKPSDALNQVVAKQLTQSFGKGLGARIIFAARDATGAPVVGLDRTSYRSLVETIGRDDRVRQMWGDFGVKTRVWEWKKLVSE